VSKNLKEVSKQAVRVFGEGVFQEKEPVSARPGRQGYAWHVEGTVKHQRVQGTMIAAIIFRNWEVAESNTRDLKS
jgi:hypothetical protein